LELTLREDGTTRFIGIIDGKDGAYGVVFPDLPGCTSAGATADEAARNAVEAVTLWAEDAIAKGEDLPRPRAIAELMADEAVMANVRADGSVMVAIPLIVNSGRPVRFNWSTDAGLIAAIDDDARAQKITRAAWLASAAREKLERSA
jgi:predicted RNase H-like HicB family nuclease